MNTVKPIILDLFINNEPTNVFRVDLMHHLKNRPKRFGGEAASTPMRLQKMKEEHKKGQIRAESKSKFECTCIVCRTWDGN